MELIDRQALIDELCKNCGKSNLEECKTDPVCATRIWLSEAPTVEAVILPCSPRAMLRDRNPFNTDAYCPECGTNLSGYYGDEPLPIITCFYCGAILDPYQTTTMDGGAEDG